MKKYIAAAVIAGLIGAAAFADTNTVASANVLGYNRITTPSNQLILVALDFNTTNNTINGLFGSLPTGTQVSLWDSSPAPTGQKWVVFGKLRTGWSPSGTNVIGIGSGVFLKVPAVTNIYLSGDVPTNAAATLVTASNLLKILSYPYPVDMTLTNTALAKGASVGEQISLWTTNGWAVYGKLRTGWSPSAATNVVLKIGNAMFYKAVTNRVVTEVRPYTNLFN